MRPIDADVLKEKFIKVANTMANDGFQAYAGAMEEAAKMTERQPTIEAEPVRHGRWYDKKWDEHPHMHDWHCSICEYRGSVNPIGPSFKYCPNCGAKMDEGAK